MFLFVFVADVRGLFVQRVAIAATAATLMLLTH